ncbi:MAG: amidohydrolase family protein, partial [Candidatus Omnitrophica bacterium]|nr:amidohydrolase family protein [Candidatus Omnitrophota bacterium]
GGSAEDSEYRFGKKSTGSLATERYASIQYHAGTSNDAGFRFYHATEVKFVFANFGGALPFLQHRFDATYEMLRGINFVKDLKANPTQYLKNIYVDTGGDKVKANFQLALELFGAKHILWGSDWPAKKDIKTGMQAVKDLTISQEEKSAILGGNLETIVKGEN